MGRQANASSHNRLQHFAFCRFFHREKTLYRLVHDFLAVPLDPGRGDAFRRTCERPLGARAGFLQTRFTKSRAAHELRRTLPLL